MNEPSNLVHKSPVGILQPRKGGEWCRASLDYVVLAGSAEAAQRAMNNNVQGDVSHQNAAFAASKGIGIRCVV